MHRLGTELNSIQKKCGHPLTMMKNLLLPFCGLSLAYLRLSKERSMASGRVDSRDKESSVQIGRGRKASFKALADNYTSRDKL